MHAGHQPRPAAFVAAHRFGLGEASLDRVGADARRWLLDQIGPADPQRGRDLATSTLALQRVAQYQQLVAARRREAPASQPDTRPDELRFVDHYRPIVQADLRARLATAITTERPFAERLAMFWCNHFTVSMAKASARCLVGAFEREAIRPHIAGRFETLLSSAIRHPAMLRYLDNDQSAGPRSPLVTRLRRRAGFDGMAPPRPGGLNENLARELLELHTLGAAGGGGAYGGWGGYTQADVTELARVLTGWRVPLRLFATETPAADATVSAFDPAWHEPEAKTVLGHRVPEGPAGLDHVVRLLATHPSTARHIAFKLARHFTRDDPPSAFVTRLADAWQASGGDLAVVSAALVECDEPWQPGGGKLKTPQEFVITSARLLGLGEAAVTRQPDAGLAQLGQRLQAAPSPAGWPDQASEWLGPEALWKRVEWAARVGERLGRQVDARRLADASLGPVLSEATRRQIDRAADGPQALTLLLLSPELAWR